MITFGPKGFRRWLEALPPGTEAGKGGKCHDCPLARYGNAQGAYFTSCSSLFITVHSDRWSATEKRPTQLWQDRFMRNADIAVNLTVGASITREQALAVLDKIEGVTP